MEQWDTRASYVVDRAWASRKVASSKILTKTKQHATTSKQRNPTSEPPILPIKHNIHCAYNWGDTMNWLLVALGVGMGVLAVVLPACYLYAVSAAAHFPTLRNKRICLLIAHPDDEAMFFAPTLLALTAPETGNHVKILCLSKGA